MSGHILETEAELVCAHCCALWLAPSHLHVVLSEKGGLLGLPWVSCSPGEPGYTAVSGGMVSGIPQGQRRDQT